jgi:hypothetical protein
MTVPSLDEGDEITDEYVDAVTSGVNTMGPVTFTPDADTFRQNNANVALLAGGRYWYVKHDNGLLVVHFGATINAAGTAGTSMDWKLPVALLNADDAGGTFHYLDNGTAYRSGTIRALSTTRVQGFIDNQAGPFGQLPNVQAAAGDTFRITVHGRWA